MLNGTQPHACGCRAGAVVVTDGTNSGNRRICSGVKRLHSAVPTDHDVLCCAVIPTSEPLSLWQAGSSSSSHAATASQGDLSNEFMIRVVASRAVASRAVAGIHVCRDLRMLAIACSGITRLIACK